jgi:hypothetical protein
VSAMSRGCLLRLGGGWGDESMTNTFQHCPLIAHFVNPKYMITEKKETA